MQTPYGFLLDLKKLHELLQKGYVTEEDYESQKEKLLENVLHNEKYYTTYSCIEAAGDLKDAGAITEEEFEEIKDQAFHDEDSERRDDNGGFFAKIYAFFSGIGIFLDCVIIFGFIALCFAFPPLFILLILGLLKWWWDTHWNYDNLVKKEIISKAIERNKD